MQSADEVQDEGSLPQKRRIGGSRKGRPNKISATIKDDVLRAFDAVGRWKYLVRQAEENPRAFMHLLSRCVSQEVAGSIDVEPMHFVVQTLSVVSPPGGVPGVLKSPFASDVYVPALGKPEVYD